MVKELFSFTEGFLSSEWFALGCLIVFAISTIILFVIGITSRIKQRKDEEINKKLGIVALIVLILIAFSFGYVALLMSNRISIMQPLFV